MTAINTFLRRDRGFMMTDGAFYTADGIPRGFGSKTFAIPNLHAVIAARGFSGISPELMSRMSLHYRDFDDMAGRLEKDLTDYSEEVEEYLIATGFPHFEFHVLGWSKTADRPKAFVFTNRPDDSDHLRLYEVKGYVLGPDVDDNETFEVLPRQNIFLGLPAFDADMERHFDPLAHGVPIMMAQRRQLDTNYVGQDESGQFCSVGGHIAVAEVDRDGITQRILHRWADEAGTAMQVNDLSEKDVAVTRRHLEAARSRISGPAQPSTLNRQQRRALERQRAKELA